MLLLSTSGLARGFTAEPLFADLALELYSGERVGLVGPNGAGKTTLMRTLAGLDAPEAGDVRSHAGARVGLLQQHPEFKPGRTLFAEAQSALDELIAAQHELVLTAERLATATDEAERKSLAARYDRLNELLRHQDAYAIDHRVEQVLEGLGFKPDVYQRDLTSFSGGQQRRLLLGKLLLAAPDVMLLDEPSNHLDIDTTRWLEDYLVAQPQAMLIISHDRYFLNRVVTKIFELHDKKVTVYPGSYSKYRQLSQERYDFAIKQYEAQREYIQKQEEYIRRVHYGQLAKQAQSRQKQLDRVERVDRPSLITAPSMTFGKARRTGDVVFQVDDLSKSYATPLFRDLSFQVPRGKRLGIMGPNGCGKTTLLRIMLGDEKADAGSVKLGQLVDVGYLDQHLKLLPDDEPVIRAVWPEPDPSVTEQTMRDLLSRFGLSGEIVFQPIKSLSGGERSRAALAHLVARGVNVLVLDEPTNHLDLWACESLEEALKNYEGTVIVVSHDRYFLNSVADLLVVFEGECKTQVVYGNYDTYELLRARQAAAAQAKAGKAKPAAVAASSAPPKPAKRKRKFPYRKVEELEAEIAAAETVVAEQEALLASGDVYRDANRLMAVTKAFEAAKAALAGLYEHWEEAVELN